jgi:hypothetical protein
MVLEMLEMLEIPSIGHKCPLDIFKFSVLLPKMHIFRVYCHVSLPYHLWCGIFKTQNPLFFKFQKPLKNKTSLIKCKMDIFKNQKCPS